MDEVVDDDRLLLLLFGRVRGRNTRHNQTHTHTHTQGIDNKSQASLFHLQQQGNPSWLNA
jgi:hypothetical protein